MSIVRVVGNLTWDRLIETPAFPLPNSDYLTLDDATHAGGAGGNVAAGLALLGIPSAMVAAVGRDKGGADLIAELDGYGVDTSLVQRVDPPTSEFLCIIDPHGDRSFLLDPRQAAFSLEPDGVQPGDDMYAFVGCQLSLAAQILERSAVPRPYAFANIGFWAAAGELEPENMEVLDRLDCLFLNNDEFDGLPNPVRERLTSSEFLDEPRRLVITGGAAEAVVLTAEGSTALAPASPVEVVNTLGCGDAFMSGYLAAHIAGLEVEKCLFTAHECAGRVAASRNERFLGQFEGIAVA